MCAAQGSRKLRRTCHQPHRCSSWHEHGFNITLVNQQIQRRAVTPANSLFWSPIAENWPLWKTRPTNVLRRRIKVSLHWNETMSSCIYPEWSRRQWIPSVHVRPALRATSHSHTVSSSYRGLSGAHSTGLIIDVENRHFWILPDQQRNELFPHTIGLSLLIYFRSCVFKKPSWSHFLPVPSPHLSFSPILPAPAPSASSAEFCRVNVPAVLQPQRG